MHSIGRFGLKNIVSRLLRSPDRGDSMGHEKSRARPRNRPIRSAGRIASALLAVLVVSAALTPLRATATTPGTPGVPQVPTTLYGEDFENRPGSTPIVRLTGYTGVTGETYTADAQWLTACNGWVSQWNQPVGSAAQVADCGNQGSWNAVQQLAQALGEVRGQTQAAARTNFALSAFTNANPGAGLIEFQTNQQIPLISGVRFLSFFVNAVAINCGVSHPQLQFYSVSPSNIQTAIGGVIDPCTGTGFAYEALGTSGAGTATGGTFTGNGAFTYSQASIGIRMRNQQATGNGNDGAIDNIALRDVTPQLDKAFNPTTVVAGGTSTLTFTITNTTDLLAKPGWSFTDNLPTGLVLATPTAATTTCASGVVTATAGGSTVSVTGNLNAGQASCTASVNVTSSTPVTYTNGPDNITNASGISPPGNATVAFGTGGTGNNTATVRGGGDPSCPLTGATAAHCSSTVTVPIVTDYICSASTIFVGQAVPTQLNAETYGSGASVFVPIGPASAWQYNSIAYRASDNFIYAISSALDAAHPVNHLLRIDPGSGAVADLGALTGMPAAGGNNGAFDAAGNYYFGADSATSIYRINLATLVATPITLTPAQTLSTIDFTYTNGFFWGATSGSNPQTITRINPATGAIARFPAPALPVGVYGAAWTFGNGNLGFSNNTTGVVYQLAVANPAATPTFSLVASTAGPASAGNNDGTSCIAPPTDLSIVKTGPASVGAGGAISWTLTVTNNGPSGSSGFTVSDTVPAGVTAIASPTAGCTVAGSTVTCVEGPLANGATFVITINGTAPTPFTAAITNTTTVTGNEQDPTPGNNTSTQVVTPPPPQLTVTKTASPNPFVVGQPASYTVTVQNTGTSPTVGNITIADTLPTGITLTAATGTNWSCTGTTALSCTFTGTLAAGASTTLTLNVAVGASATSGTNTATASGGGDPTCPAAAHCIGTTPIVPVNNVQLTVTKTATPNPFVVGQPATYTVTVQNIGTSPSAGNIVITDTLPTGITLTTATGTNWSCAGTTALSCTFTGTLAAGASTTLTLNVAVGASATNGNNTATASGGGDTSCPAAAHCTGTVPVPVNSPQLTVTKTATPNPFVVGQPATYTVTVQNTGTSPTVGNITIVDSLPSGITLTAASGTNWSCAGTTALSCTFTGTLAVGASTTLSLNVAVAASATSGTNTATASGGGDPSCPAAAHCIGTTPIVPVDPSADIAVTKTVDNATPNVGDNVTFTVTATNNGPSDATGVQITDALPSGLVFVSATPSQGTYDSATGLWSVGALSNGANATLDITATVTASGTITNIATRTGGDQPDPDSSNNSGGSPINAAPSADIQVAKSVDNPAPNVGSNVTFTITATNAGPNDATGVAVTDVLPAGLTFVSATTSQGTYDSATGLWSIGNVANGVSVTLQIVATVTQAGPLTNTATGTANENDPVPSNNEGGSSLNGQSADIQVVKTVDDADPIVGDTISFTIVATNNGPSDATGVEITDALPAGLSFVSATPSQGTYDNTTGVWSVGALTAAGPTATATLTIVASVTQPGSITNTATVTASDQPDPITPNNSSSVPLNAAGSADLVVDKTGPASAVPGTDVTYTITVTNNGPSDALAVSLNDPTPAGLSFVSASAPCATGFPCALGDMVAGASTIVTVTFSIPADYTGPLSNTATVTSPTGDPDPSNNTSTVPTPLAPSADITVVKTGPATVTAGGAISYTVVVTNNGPSDANGSAFSDAVPAGITGVAAICGSETGGAVCGTVNVAGNNVSSTITTLPSGGSVTFTISGTAPITGGTLTNTASATPPSGTTDPNPGDNTSTVDTDVGATANIAVVKTGPASATPGANVTYTLAVTNNGPSTATSVSLADPTPAGLSFVSADAPCAAGFPCALGDIAAGGSVTVTVTFAVPANFTGSIANTATATSPTPDPDPSDNTSTVTTPTAPSANITVVKTGPATATPGANVTYTLLVTNAGPSTAIAVSLADPTPAGLSFVSAGAPCAAGFPCALGDIAAGGSVTVTVTFAVPANFTGSIVNTATVTSPTPDPTPGDNTSTVTTPTAPTADITVVKTGPATIAAGGTISYSVVVTNNGPSAANGASFSDAVPAGITGVAASCGTPTGGAVCGTVNVAGNNVTSTITTLPAIGSVTFTITGTAPITGGTLTNTASATPPAGVIDPNPGDNTSTVGTNVTPAADIAVLKTVDNATPNVGDTVTFTVLTTNNGPSDATGVAVTDGLPFGLSLVSATPSQGTYAAATGLWTIGALANGASATLTITATVTAPGAITNTATVTASDQADPDPSNNSSGAGLNAGASADIQLLKTVDNAVPNVGSNVTFTITATNAGPNDATGVEVTDQLPAGLTFVSATPSQGTYDSASGVWVIGALANGNVAMLTITATVTQAGPITNTATVTAENENDPVQSNNQSGTTLNGQQADIQVVKTVDDNAPSVGDTVSFTITATNLGPSDATGVEITDVLPAGLSFVSATPSQGTYANATGLWAVGSLTAAGPTATATLTIVATVTASGPIVNTATHTGGDQPDPNTTNDSSSVPLNGQPLADLAVVKTGPATVTPGNDVVYTIVVTNNGPSDASAVQVADPTPAGLTFVSNAGACTTAYPCAIGTLAVGATATITSTYTVPADYAGPNPIANTATATSTTPDPDNSNNQGSSNTGVGPGNADLAIVKNGPATVASGGAISYTLTISNNGPSPANGAAYSDNVPAGITGITATCGSETGGAVCATQPTVAGNAVSGTIGTLPSGGAVIITINGTAPVGPVTLTNSATVTPPAGVTDPDPTDDTSTVGTDVTTQSANLGVVKTGPASASAGTNVTYTLTVTNAGPDTATAVSLADPTPAGLSFVSASAPCAAGFPCALGDMVAGGSTIVTVTFAIPLGYSGTITNTATVTSPVGDPDPSDNTSTVTTPVVVVPPTTADLAVVKTGPATIATGGAISYTLTISNNGPAAADGASYSDPVPAGITGIAATCGGETGGAACVTQPTVAGNTVSGTIGTLPSGGAVIVTITGTAPASAGTLTNTATVAPPSGITDPNPADNSSDVGTAVLAPNLLDPPFIAKSVTAVDANTLLWQVVLINSQNAQALAVELRDPLPAGMSFVSGQLTCQATGGSTISNCAFDAPNNRIVADALIQPDPGVTDPAVAANEVVVTFQAQYTSTPAPVTNTATAYWDANDDGNVGDDIAGGQTPVPASASYTPAAPMADLQVVKTGPATATPGTNVSYTVTVTNYGPSSVTDAVLDDPTPAGLSFVSASAPCTGGFPCTIGALNVGASVTLTTVYAIPVGYTGPIDNTATATSASVPDPTPSNNASTVLVPTGGGGPAPITPVPVDARWMLLLLASLLTLVGARRAVRKR